MVIKEILHETKKRLSLATEKAVGESSNLLEKFRNSDHCLFNGIGTVNHNF